VVSSSVAGAQDRLAPFGLDPNTTYYFRAGALWGGTTAYAPVVLSTATLAKPVAGTAVYEVFATSVVVNWLPLPSAPPDASSNSASGYVLEVAVSSGFAPLWSSVYLSGPALSTVTVTGLLGGATYHLRVGALNWNGAASYAPSVSTVTYPLPFVRAAQTPYGVAMASAGVNVTVSWMPVERFDDGGVFSDPSAATASELTGYSVYRATSVIAGTWTRQVLLSSSALAWTDPAGGPQYFYHVRSENASGQSNRSVIRAVGTLSAFAVAPDDRSYFEVTAASVRLIEGVAGQAQTAYLIEASSRTEEVGGRVFKSIEFGAKQGGLTAMANLAIPVMGRLKLRYEMGVSSVIAAAAAPATQNNLGVYWYNGSRWVQMYGRLDQTDQTLNVETVYLGRYQIRSVERAASFAFNTAGLSNRFVTPNGDGKNDGVVFTFDNPRDAQVRGRILDMRGRVVVSEMLPGPAHNTLEWRPGAAVPGGIYLYQLEGEGKTFTGTVVILK
jgi:hypothetical protein